MRPTFEIALAFVAGYLAGSVPLGLLVSKAVAGIDIRRYGTGGIGASNVRHNLGTFPAAVVALGIFLQGLVPPLAVRLLGGSEAAVAAAAVGAMIGYGWPVFMGFKSKGGRGVGVSTGAAAVLFPSGLIPLFLAYALGKLFEQLALGVLFGFLAYTGWVLYFADSTADWVGASLLLALVMIRRLEGVGEDLERGAFPQVIANRLFLDRRPGQRLTGSADEERSD